MPENSRAFASRLCKSTLLILMATVIVAVSATNIQAQARAASADPEDQAASGIGSAVARLETPIRDFGRVAPDSDLQANFAIGNGGTVPLEILRIEPTYGCSVIGDPPKIIPPGESRTLTLKLEAATLRGYFDKQIVVTTSDPTNSTLILRMRGEMRRIIEVSPPAAGFGKIEPDELRERVITISNGSSEPFTVEMDAPSPAAPFIFQLIETVRGREYKLFVNTRPPYRTGAIRSDVMLRTNIESQKEIFVSAYAIIPADFEVTPPTIPIPPIIQDGEAASLPSIQILNFSNYGKKPIRVTGATCSDSTVNASVFEVIAGKQYRVTVELPPRYRATATDHFVTLITDDEAHRSIEIPIGQQAAQARHAQSAAPAATQPAQTAAGAKKKFPALELIGKAAPPITLTTLDGAPVGNPEFEFHPATVLNFFAANCPYCKRQIPKVEALRAKYESLGVRFVNVCETMRTPFTPDQVRGVMADLSANLEIAMDAGNRYGRSYRVTGFPVLFVVRPDGTIDHAVSGDKANLVQMIEEKLDALISEGAMAKSPAEDAPTSRPAS